MQLRTIILSIFFLLSISACKPGKEISKVEKRTLPEITVRPSNESYRSSYTIRHDLLNVVLDVSFNWEKQYLYGKAVLTLQPHFYATDYVWLNARGMEIDAIRLLKDNDSIPVKYTYENDSLRITLDKIYTKGEQFKLYIKYIAKPEELKDTQGSVAIKSDKGLFFINPTGEDPVKPREIWTQGETQANSVWFPCIESPNQKMTQEIHITVDSSYVTLSNGLKIKSTVNSDGTRTDIWKQTIPHAPYLVMMAIGKYAIVKDEWRGKEVSYYVEPEYKNVAGKIFGNTPEMMEFFSTKLKFDFPWDKYSEVVVRDYISGAMENSSATVFGEFMERNDRELVDAKFEDIVSHELFHQWFGDVVTCESWSNIPLNESFASYGEYLWSEYKYGREVADIALLSDMNKYFREARVKQVNLVRYQYDDREDLYDRHSYEKGGAILHMLRKYVGDDAFYASLNKYLEDNKFKSVEVANLRLAFEAVTGEDLNWFFNEWFFDKGHPDLEISYGWDQENKEASVIISQNQDLTTTPLYKIPMDVDIYSASEIKRERIILTQKKQVFTFKCDSKPDLINTDAEKMIVGIKTDKHSADEWITLYKRGPLFMDRYEALQNIVKDYKADSPQGNIVKSALSDPNWKIRDLAITNVGGLTKSDDNKETLNKLIAIAQTDKKSTVRELALLTIDGNYNVDETDLYKKCLNDSSYLVFETALNIFLRHDVTKGLSIVKEYEKDTSAKTTDLISGIYSRYGNEKQADFMLNALNKNKSGHSKYNSIYQYGKYLLHIDNTKIIEDGLLALSDVGKNAQPWYNRMSAAQVLSDLSSQFSEKQKDAEKNNDNERSTKYSSLQLIANNYLKELKKTETNPALKKIYYPEK